MTTSWPMPAVLLALFITNVTSAAETNTFSADCLPIDKAHRDQIIDQIAPARSEAVISLSCESARCDVSFELSGREIYSTRTFPRAGKLCVRTWEVPAAGTTDCEQRIKGIQFEFWPPRGSEPDSIDLEAGPSGFDAKSCLGEEMPQLVGEHLPVISVYFAKSARITVFDYQE